MISFTDTPLSSNERPLVVTDDGEIDVVTTIAGLRGVSPPTPILLEERYRNVQDGLGLLLRLRMETALEASRSPVYVRLTHPVENHIRRHTKFAVLCTEGVALLADGQEPSDKDAPTALTDTQLLNVLEGLPVRPGGSDHDLTNRWGPVRLWRGLQRLRPSDEVVPNPEWVGRIDRELRAEETYAYLLALADLRGPTMPVSGDTSSWSRWRSFARGVSGGPLRILLLDDEIDRGWGDAVTAALSVPSKVTVDTSLAGINFDADSARVEETALGNRWDLVLADLRTGASDRAASPARGATQYGGADWIRRIKSTHPDTAVVAFTASNKAWSVQELRELGIDRYWVKESPEFGVDDAYSAANAARLLTIVREALKPRIEARPIWSVIERVQTLSGAAEVAASGAEWRNAMETASTTPYVAGWSRALGLEESHIKRRLASIVGRFRRAYGFLVLGRSAHAEQAFALRSCDLAFLSLWGCLNEVVALYFSDPDYQRDLSRAHDSAFVRRSPTTGAQDTYWHIVKGQESIPSSVPRRWRSDLTPGTGTSTLYWPTSRKDTARVAWLLDDVGPSGLADRFDQKRYRGRPGLRELRNNLEDAHGDVLSHEQAILDDVHALCDVWRSLLVTPYV